VDLRLNSSAVVVAAASIRSTYSSFRYPLSSGASCCWQTPSQLHVRAYFLYYIFLLSSIMGCHSPLVGHSIFLRTDAVKQCGRMRMLRHAQRWLKNIELPFLPVDQIGFSNLQANNRAEYWSERHVPEDFELMIHLYNLGFFTTWAGLQWAILRLPRLRIRRRNHPNV
jgi:hypothetical protein